MHTKAWMDTGGFARYIETVLAPWWTKQLTSLTCPGPFPAKRMLLVCDNASVHKADELKKLMIQEGEEEEEEQVEEEEEQEEEEEEEPRKRSRR